MSMNYGIVTAPISTAAPGTLGTSNSLILSQSFPDSPINGSIENAVLSDTLVKSGFKSLVMRGTDESSSGEKGYFPDDLKGSQGYWGFEQSFNRDYVGYGNLTIPDNTVAWAQPGDPMNSWMPNLWSAPNANPFQQPPPLLADISNPPISPQAATQDFVESSMGYGVKNENADVLGIYLMGKSSLSPDLNVIQGLAHYNSVDGMAHGEDYKPPTADTEAG